MTRREKDVIRLLPCSHCGNIPPFIDGSCCHPHRVIRQKDGGRYTVDNVIPLCPICHRDEDKIVMITSAVSGGRKGGLRTHELHPDMAQKIGRVLGHSGTGGRALAKRKHLYGLTPAEHAHAIVHIRKYASEGGRKGYPAGLGNLSTSELATNGRRGGQKGIVALYTKLSPEERTANARKGAYAANALMAKRRGMG